jgi:hypothetical protein
MKRKKLIKITYDFKLRDFFVLLIKLSTQTIKLKLTYTKTTSDNS